MTPDRLGLAGLGYAVCYPFGIAGILLTMLLRIIVAQLLVIFFCR